MKKTFAALAAIATLVALNACSSTTPPAGAPSEPAAPSQSPSSTPATTTATSDQTPTSRSRPETSPSTRRSTTIKYPRTSWPPCLTLTWNRNAGIEITELSEPLTETGPFYTDVQAGDIVYYNPMESITIIYAHTSSVPTLTYMGRITSDLDDFEDLPDTIDMRIELQ